MLETVQAAAVRRFLLVSLVVGATSAGAAVPGAGAGGRPGAAGPVASGLDLNATAEVLYDSNQLRLTPASAAAGGTGHRDDFRYSPALSGRYSRSTGRISLVANAAVGRDFFQYNRYLDRNHYLGGGTITYHVGPSCQTSVNGSFASRQGGVRGSNGVFDDPANPDNIGTVIDNVQSTAVYGINAGCGSPSGRLSFGGGYTHSELSNGSRQRKFGDSISDTFTGNVGLGILRPGQLSLNGSYSTIGYPNRKLLGGAIPAQLLNTVFRTYRIGVSFQRPIGTRLSGTIGASFLHTDPAGGQAAYNAPAYNLGLTYTASPRLNFNLVGSRDILPSTSAGALFRVVDTVQFVTHYKLGRAISVDANAGLIRNDYRQPFAIPGEAARRSETTKNVGLGVTYAPRPLYNLALFVGHTMRQSDPSIFNYDSTKVSATLAIHL